MNNKRITETPEALIDKRVKRAIGKKVAWLCESRMTKEQVLRYVEIEERMRRLKDEEWALCVEVLRGGER